MRSLINYKLSELEKILVELGEAKFRAKQIFDSVNKGICLSSMTNISKALKQKLIDNGFSSFGMEIIEKIESKDKSTCKYLFLLDDKNIIEGVSMQYSYGTTACISTQVGCRMKCAFCASGIDGLVRNLTDGEILAQVLLINNDILSKTKDKGVKNIVLMGSGEPFDNYDNLIKFLIRINDESSLNISRRNISLSTCGLVDKIYKFADQGFNLTLTISLHASNDYARSLIMPISNKYKIGEIIKAAKYYFKKTGRRVIFEYSLISGINDTLKNAEELTNLLKGFACHVNLINLNFVEEKEFKASDKNKVKRFKEYLEEKGISVTLRRTMGADIDGACGQLRRKFLGENERES